VALRVVGAGVGRTGTSSLKLALEQLLGGPCLHMSEILPNPERWAEWSKVMYGEPVDVAGLADGFVATVDWPAASWWPELVAANPDALVLLSVRPADDWYRSAANTVFEAMAILAKIGHPWLTAFLHGLGQRFCNELDDPDAMIAAYERHNAAVRAGVPAERLLEWTPSDGWDPICERLGLPVPTEPFPRTNSTEEFRQLLGMPPLEA
jgi:hypothetical protein